MSSNKLNIYRKPRVDKPRIVLGFSGWMNGGDVSTGTPYYTQDTVITTPDITLPSDNSIYLPSTPVTLTCSSSTDSDTYHRCVGNTWTVGPVSDNTISYTWSAKWTVSGQNAGSFPSGNTGQSVTWNAPASTGDVTIKVVADDDGTKYNDNSVDSSITVGIVSVDLDIWNGKTNGTGDPVADNDEESTEAYLLVNWDDDNSDDDPDLDDSSVTGENDLSKISLSYSGASTGTLELIKTGSNFKIWQNSTKGTEQTDLGWDLASESYPPTLWVEGRSASGSERDVQLELKYTRSGNSKSDTVKATVVMINLGNAVYREHSVWAQNNRGHGAIVYKYTGTCTPDDLNDSSKFLLIEMPGPSNNHTLATITDRGGFPDYLDAFGCYTNPSISFSDRLKILKTAKEIYNKGVDYVLEDAIEPPNWNDTVAGINSLRCDGFIEVCYEIHGINVWGKIVGGGTHYDIKNNSYQEEHDDYDAVWWKDTLMPATQCGYDHEEGERFDEEGVDWETTFEYQSLCVPIGHNGGDNPVE